MSGKTQIDGSRERPATWGASGRCGESAVAAVSSIPPLPTMAGIEPPAGIPPFYLFFGSTEQTAPSRAGYPGNTERNGLEMSIKEATPEEIQALKSRINRRQSDRRYEMEMDEAVAMACRANRRPTAAPAARVPSRENVIVVTGTAMIAGAAALLSGAGVIPAGYAAMTASVALAGAVGEIARAF